MSGHCSKVFVDDIEYLFTHQDILVGCQLLGKILEWFILGNEILL